MTEWFNRFSRYKQFGFSLQGEGQMLGLQARTVWSYLATRDEPKSTRQIRNDLGIGHVSLICTLNDLVTMGLAITEEVKGGLLHRALHDRAHHLLRWHEGRRGRFAGYWHVALPRPGVLSLAATVLYGLLRSLHLSGRLDQFGPTACGSMLGVSFSSVKTARTRLGKLGLVRKTDDGIYFPDEAADSVFRAYSDPWGELAEPEFFEPERHSSPANLKIGEANFEFKTKFVEPK